MRAGVLLIGVLCGVSLASSEGEDLFRANCLKCHRDNSPAPVFLMKEKFRGKPELIVELAKKCPWGKNLSELEVELIAEWLSGEE